MLFALIQIVTPAILPDASERVRGKSLQICALLELNLLQIAQQALHNKLSCGFLHNKRLVGVGGVGEWDESRETRFPLLFKGELKYMY